MVHPKLIGYSVLEVMVGEKSPENIYEMFVGRIHGDNELHLLGYRPANLAAYFSENECSSLDFGVVKLPNGRKSLNDLVKGDILHVKKEDGKTGELDGAVYRRMV